MPELPETYAMAAQMHQHLRGTVFSRLEALQPKCLNLPPQEAETVLAGRTLEAVRPHGKWLMGGLSGGARLLMNLGMGAEVRLSPAELTDRVSVRLHFQDGRVLAFRFWWFGYVHALPPGGAHQMTDDLAPDALHPAWTSERFQDLLRGSRAAVKTLLLRQDRIAGIGNFYIHNILWRAGVHPLSPACSLGEEAACRLLSEMRAVLEASRLAGGASYERDLFGNPGGYEARGVGYCAGRPCPSCGAEVAKLRTGATTSFLCPSCQPLRAAAQNPKR